MKIWKLKKGHDARLRSKHPWVFSNELLDSPKSIKPGEPIEIQDIQGHFLARGYGNPHSLISFRALSFSTKDENPTSPSFVIDRLFQAWTYRKKCGFHKSFRVCYSEADQIPGLILDRYFVRIENVEYQVFSYQLLTAGMNLIFKENWSQIFSGLVDKTRAEGLSHFDWEHTLILERNDVSIRKLEGIEVEEARVLKTVNDNDLKDITIIIENVNKQNPDVEFQVNLYEGQKTGFFLDQTFNMRLLVNHLEQQKDSLKNKKIKILDLCCYMGQWSSQIVANLKAWGISCEVHLVDISALALEKAKFNLEKYQSDQYPMQILTYKKDVLEISDMPENHFDIIISDPPAFVKNKKDIHQGLHAYYKLNLQAFKLAAPGATVVSCTCSGLVQMDDFKSSLRKSILKSGKYGRCVHYGGQGSDHPTIMSFSEGFYLKMIMHQLD